MIIKVTDQSQTQSKPMSVAENETFDSFKEKVEAKLGFRIERFLCSELEIGDDATLTEMLKSAPRPPSTVHCLVAVKSGELLLDENNNPVDLESIRKQINEIETGEKEKNASTLQYYELKIRALQNDYNNLLGKSIKAERSRIAEIKVEIDTAQICKSSFCEMKTAEVVDVCFLMECTTSMKLFVMEAKTLVHRLVEKLGKRFVDLKLRCAFVGYRDYCGIEDRVNVIAFTDDKEAFKEAVDSVKPIGGGDLGLALDVFGGLDEVLKLEWRSPTRLLFHIGIAPCHGSRFNDPPINDHFPKGDPRGLDIDTLLSNLTSKNIDYYFAEIHPCTQKMINAFNEILLKNKGKPIEVLRVSNSNELLSSVSWSISNSILNSQSLSMVEVRSKPMKNYQVEAPINWSDSSEYELFEAYLYETSFSGDITEIRTNRVEYKTRKVDLYMAKKPFAKGGLRFAFAALINMGSRENPDIVKCVLKESVFKDVKYNTEDYMKSLIEIQVISKFLAEKFKSVCELKLKFLSVNLLRINSTGGFYSCEEFVDGSFTKWTNNSGIVNEEDYSVVLNAFSHWSYQATDKYLIVTDLQGFKTGGDEYVLTDPAITCVQEPLRFSSTNLAVKGVEKFFRSHQCNRICRELRLEKNALQTMSDI